MAKKNQNFASEPVVPPSPILSPNRSPSPDRRQRSRSPKRRELPSPPKIGQLQKLLITSDVNQQLYRSREAAYEALKDLPRLAELDYQPSTRYMEASEEDVLYPLIEGADCLMVAGGFFGDEGKGKTVDAIARHPDVKVVARVNSGENAGHTVFSSSGIKYAFNLCPSGLLTPGKINVIGPECVMDPVSFMLKEISQLTRDGVEYKDRLFVGNVHLVGPHHKLLDLMGSWKSPNTSTIQGMGPVHASKAKRIGLRMDHLFNDREDAAKRLERDLVDYWGYLKNLGINESELLEKALLNSKIQKHVIGFIEAQDKCKYMFELYDKWVVNNPDFPQRTDVSHMLRQTIASGGKVLLEGPQSYHLSNASEKFWESGTSAHTCASGMLAASRLNLTGLRTVVINIHKTPGASRVGSGANPVAFVPQDYFSKIDGTKDDFELMQLDWADVSAKYFGSVQSNGILKPGIYENEVGQFDLGVAMAAASCVHPTHREFGVTSGRPRVVGFFDCVAFAEMITAQGPYCSVSAFDRADDYDELGVCVAYVYHHPTGKSLISNGKVFNQGDILKVGDQLPTQQILQHCHPIIKKVSGWRDTPICSQAEKWKSLKHPVQLPDAVCNLIDIIEHYTKAKIISIGNGPGGQDIIYFKRL